MSFKNNSPTFSYISWNSCYITYDGVDYIIEDGYTCMKYVYWNYNNNPYKFETTNLLQDETITKQLIAVNDKGMVSTVELDNISLTFTENGSGGVSGQIVSGLTTLYDKQGTNTNYEERFTTIETGLNEITTLMGELEATDDGLSERISSIQQTTENISMEISNVQKEYSKDREDMELRDKIGEALLIFNAELGLYTSDINDAMKDNELSASEKTTLITRVNNLKRYKNNIDTIINEIISKISNENGNVTALREEKTIFGNAFNGLMSIYDTIVTDNAFTTTEITTMTNAIGSMNERCISLGNVLEDSILLPFNGKLIEEITKFSIKSNEIMLGVSEIEKSVESNMEKIAELKITSDEISSSISKVETKLDDIDEVIEEKIINVTVGATNLLTNTSDEWEEILVSSVGIIKETFHCSELGLNVGEKIAFGVDIGASRKNLSARIDFWSDFNGTNSQTFKGDIVKIGKINRSIVINEIPEGYEYITLSLNNESIESTSTTEFFKCAKLERGSISTDWSPSPKDTETRIDDALDSFISDWEGQIDGVIQTYSQVEDPANSWDEDEKEGHEGDIWYDTMNKNIYRWDGATWIKFENEDAILATELAQSKAQIFVTTPVPPYYKNDIWITDLNGNGVVKTCVNGRLTGNYDESDWVEGLKYTDDSKVSELEDDLHNNYSTTVEMHSEINQSVEGVLSTVSESYYTKDNIDGQINLIEGSISEIKQTSDSFVVRIEGVENSTGNALTSGTSTQYYLSTSLTNLSGGTWQDTAPQWANERYMWQRMKYVHTNGTITYGTPVCVAGAKGEDGTSVKILGAYESLEELNLAHPDNEIGDGYIINGDLYVWTGDTFKNVGQIKGEDGINGIDGKTSYFHVKYSDDGGETFTSNNGETVGMYIGTCVNFDEYDPTTVDSYTWALIKGEQGINGADGVDGTSVIFKGSYPSPLENPENGWCYYDSTEKKSFVYQDDTWYQMTIDGNDGEDGLSLEYKGELKNPPASPMKNWAYKDTDNGIVYIYTGSYWEVLTYDGNDGADGSNGLDGNSVFITYNSSTSIPNVPTGDGTTDGWHTTSTPSDIWLSQKVSTDAITGTWGTPIKIKGETGQSLISSTPQWYKSTSKTNQTGGSWVETMPEVTNGYYVWVRFKQVWENPTATTYTIPVLEQVVESIKDTINKQATLEQDLDGFKTTVSATYATKNEININTKNYLRDTDFSKENVVTNYINTSDSEMFTTKYTTLGNNLDIDAFIRNDYILCNRLSIANCISDGYINSEMKHNSNIILAKDTEYTMTVWLYKNDRASEAFVSIYEIDGNAEQEIASSEKITEYTGGFVKISFTFKSSSKCTTHEVRYISFANTTDYIDGYADIFIYHPILTLGSKEVDWSPSPEDYGNYLENNYSTTKEVESIVDQRADSITSSISETYASKSELRSANNNITSLTTRVSNAESKLTLDSLTTIIGSHYTTTVEVNDLITSKNYATNSKVEQTQSSLIAMFEESGGYNLIRNSVGYGGTSCWSIGAVGSLSASSTTSTKYINKRLFRFTNDTLNDSYAYSTRFPLTAGKTYTLSFISYTNADATTMRVFVRGSYSVAYDDYLQPSTYDVILASKTNISGGHTEQSITFTVPESVISGHVQVVNDGARVNGISGSVYWGDMQLEEGSVATRWTPHPNEIYSGITTIDKDGLKVSQSNYGGYTRMTSAGFYVNDGIQDVISATSSGLVVKGTITGSTIHASCRVNSDSIIYANGGIYTGQDIRGINTDAITGGLTLVTGTGHISVRTENSLHSVYIQPASGEARVTYPSQPDNYADLRLKRLVANDEVYAHGDVRGLRVYANGVQLTSDRAKKRDIELYSVDALNEICTTPVYTYHLDGDLDEEMKRIGLIMQEAPVDAVDIGGEGIDLYQMCTMMWKGIQQLKEENDKLKEEINNLKENK